MTTPNRFFLTLERSGDAFRDTSAHGETSLVPHAELAPYIEKHYTAIWGTVFVKSIGYKAKVYIPTSDPRDLPYVLVNNALTPVDGEGNEATATLDEESKASIHHHIELILHQCTNVESPFQAEKNDILGMFVFPTLARAQVNERGRPVEWSENCTVDDLMTEPRAVILGVAGSGKTTLLRYVALRLAKRASEEGQISPVPVYVPLRHADVKAQASLTWRRLNRPEVRRAWLFDGLDEVSPDALASTKSAIADIALNCPRDLLFICSRASSYDGFLRDQCAHFEIQPFSSAQISQWIHMRLHDEPVPYWRALMYNLQSVPELQSLVSNPLLLSVLVHQHKYERVLPQQRGELLGRFIDMMCRDWDGLRGFTRGGPSASIPPHRRIVVLSWIAFATKTRGWSYFSSDLLSEADEKPAFLTGSSPEIWINELADHTGVLVRSKNSLEWKFVHTLFQDYLAARYLIAKTSDVTPLLRYQVNGEDWHDVWLLACSEATDPTQLVASVINSEELSDETKALLVAGAWAQGVQLEGGFAEACRELIVRAIANHSGDLHVSMGTEPTEGDQFSLTITSETRELDSDFVRRLLALLYRARWWSDGKSAVQALRESGGQLGWLASELFVHDGWVRTLSPKNDMSKYRTELLIEILKKVAGE